MMERNTFQGPIQKRADILTPCSFEEMRAHLDVIMQGDTWLYRDESVCPQYQEYIDRLHQKRPLSLEEICAQQELYQDGSSIIVKNPFPYAVTDASHYVLFCTEAEPDLGAVSLFCQTWMQEQGLSPDDVVIFENQYWIRSVPDIAHWHVMVRGRAVKQDVYYSTTSSS